MKLEKGAKTKLEGEFHGKDYKDRRSRILFAVVI